MPAARRRLGAPAAIGLLLLLVPLAALAGGCGKSLSAGTPQTQAGAPASAKDPTAPATVTAAAPPTSTVAAPPRPSSSGKRSHRVAPAHPVPAAFQPAPGALTDAEVSAELAQLSATEREERVRQLSAAAASLAGLLPWTLESRSGTQVSVASVFTDYGLGLACGGVLGRHQLGVAHKTAPCGTLVTFTYAGRSITVPVIDRGPYIAGREWDLTGATAEALGFPGLGRIEWAVVKEG